MRGFLPIISLLFACSSEDGVKIYNSEPTATITSHTDGEQLLEAVEYTFIGKYPTKTIPMPNCRSFGVAMPVSCVSRAIPMPMVRPVGCKIHQPRLFGLFVV